MSKILNATTTITFGGSDSGGGLRLVTDSDRKTEADSRTTPAGTIVSCENSVYVRLYPAATATTRVVAATGALAPQGNLTEHDVTEVVTFSPDSGKGEMPRGATNIRIELVGTSFAADGTLVNSSVTYDAVANAVVVTPSCYSIVKVKYDIDYTLYLYTFAGRCPDAAPPAFDSSGMLLSALGSTVIKYFEDGLISAIDPVFDAYTTLHLDPPECKWSSIATSFLDSDKEKVVPSLKLEIDPDYPVRMVKSTAGNILAECCVRIYPSGAVTRVEATAGLAVYNDVMGTRTIAEIKQFTNTAVGALEYPPANSVSATVIGSLESLGNGGLSYVYGPGETVVDVTYIEGTSGAYKNPRSRRLGPNEVAICDLFRHPVPVHGIVRFDYTSRYDRYLFTFEQESRADGSIGFIPAFFVAEDAIGRASSLKLDPPSMQDQTKSAR